MEVDLLEVHLSDGVHELTVEDERLRVERRVTLHLFLDLAVEAQQFLGLLQRDRRENFLVDLDKVLEFWGGGA